MQWILYMHAKMFAFCNMAKTRLSECMKPQFRPHPQSLSEGEGSDVIRHPENNLFYMFRHCEEERRSNLLA
jgi:hypothetical protein